jgi:superfamily I DNA/RNA helicase
MSFDEISDDFDAALMKIDLDTFQKPPHSNNNNIAAQKPTNGPNAPNSNPNKRKYFDDEDDSLDQLIFNTNLEIPTISTRVSEIPLSLPVLSSESIAEFAPSLNSAQLSAVSCPFDNNSVSVVLACPGSGKTRVLTHRIAVAIQLCRIPAHNILAITFTKNAATELKARLADILQAESSNLRCCTFHALAFFLLHSYYSSLGFVQRISVQPQALQKKRIASLIMKFCAEKRKLIAQKKTAGGPNFNKLSEAPGTREENEQAMLSAIEERFSWWTTHLIKQINTDKSGLIEQLSAQRFQEITIDSSLRDISAQLEDFVTRNYHAETKLRGKLDFSDLIPLALHLLSSNVEAASNAKATWKCIFVDEAQDLDLQELQLLMIIAGYRNIGDIKTIWNGNNSQSKQNKANLSKTSHEKSENKAFLPSDLSPHSLLPPNPPLNHITLVGDADQAIYGWRSLISAEKSANFPVFHACRSFFTLETLIKHKKALDSPLILREFWLNINYRSSSYIVKAAVGLISHNSGRSKYKNGETTIKSAQSGGEKLRTIAASDSKHEAEKICTEIQRLVAAKFYNYRDIVVLVRLNAVLNSLKAEFTRNGVPVSQNKGFASKESDLRAEISTEKAFSATQPLISSLKHGKFSSFTQERGHGGGESAQKLISGQLESREIKQLFSLLYLLFYFYYSRANLVSNYDVNTVISWISAQFLGKNAVKRLNYVNSSLNNLIKLRHGVSHNNNNDNDSAKFSNKSAQNIQKSSITLLDSLLLLGNHDFSRFSYGICAVNNEILLENSLLLQKLNQNAVNHTLSRVSAGIRAKISTFLQQITVIFHNFFDSLQQNSEKSAITALITANNGSIIGRKGRKAHKISESRKKAKPNLSGSTAKACKRAKLISLDSSEDEEDDIPFTFIEICTPAKIPAISTAFSTPKHKAITETYSAGEEIPSTIANLTSSTPISNIPLQSAPSHHFSGSHSSNFTANQKSVLPSINLALPHVELFVSQQENWENQRCLHENSMNTDNLGRTMQCLGQFVAFLRCNGQENLKTSAPLLNLFSCTDDNDQNPIKMQLCHNFASVTPHSTVKWFENRQKSVNISNDKHQKGSAGRKKHPEDNKVRILTCHAAKGMEFPVVFIARLNEKVFPVGFSSWNSSKTGNAAEEEQGDEFPADFTRDDDDVQELMENHRNSLIEEERRILYVAMTRAQQRLYLSFLADPQRNEAPSPFYHEIPHSCIEEGKVEPEGKKLSADPYDCYHSVDDYADGGGDEEEYFDENLLSSAMAKPASNTSRNNAKNQKMREESNKPFSSFPSFQRASLYSKNGVNHSFFSGSRGHNISGVS